MAKYVTIASVLFQTRAELGPKRQADAKEIVLAETADVMASLVGRDLDLVVFSEGVEFFGQSTDDAEQIDRPGPFLKQYISFAESARSHVVGSLKVVENGRVYNSQVFIGPDGCILGVYHKMYLNVADEIEQGLRSGEKPLVIDTEIGRLGGIICMDINIEQAREQYRSLKPDILAFSSLYHGGFQQQEWAYHCRSFFVSAFHFHGCGILDPFGRPVKLADEHNPVAVGTVNLDRAMVHLDGNRTKFPDIQKRYSGDVLIDVPPNIGSAIIYSLTDKRSATDIVAEFGLEPVDDYLTRTITANARNR